MRMHRIPKQDWTPEILFSIKTLYYGIVRSKRKFLINCIHCWLQKKISWRKTELNFSQANCEDSGAMQTFSRQRHIDVFVLNKKFRNGVRFSPRKLEKRPIAVTLPRKGLGTLEN